MCSGTKTLSGTVLTDRGGEPGLAEERNGHEALAAAARSTTVRGGTAYESASTAGASLQARHIAGCRARRVHEHTPPRGGQGKRRQRKLEPLPVGVRDQVQRTGAGERRRHRERVRVTAPIGLVEPHAVPVDRLRTQEFAERQALTVVGQRAVDPEVDQHPHESPDVRMPLEQRPVEPGRLVVLAVRVVVAALRASDLVAHQQHRRAHAEEQQCEEVLDLPVAERLDRPDRRWGLRRRSSSSGCRRRRRGSPRRSRSLCFRS